MGESAIQDAIAAAKAKVVELREPAPPRGEADEAELEEVAEVLSDFELARLENIKRNARVLEEMGLGEQYVYTHNQDLCIHRICVYTDHVLCIHSMRPLSLLGGIIVCIIDVDAS